MKLSAEWNHLLSGMSARHLAALAGLMLTLLMVAAPAAAAERSSTNFNHLGTGFPLTGAHAQADCQTCHARGVFKGTARQCQVCHAQGSRLASTAKPNNHVQTTQPCDQCHTNTVTWSGARFRHIGMVPGNCASCHNGSTATGKPGNHVQTTASCDTCHRTTAWIPATFSHTNVSPGSCATCHNGSTATGKPGNHVQTTASCDACHRTTAWIPATFSHANVTPGSCLTCHNGSTATGKPGTHFVTTRSCDACHTTTSWTTVRYTHTSPSFSTHNSGVTCRGCHAGNNEVIAWKFGAYSGSCAGCHAGDYKTGPHKKTTVPTTISYTVAELKNCAGSCHEYTDNTFTTIKKTRSGEHRSTGGGF
jgi:hypothetical protein